MKKPRVGLYRAWVPFIDEGWSRWILENYQVSIRSMLRNGDIQAGNLRDRFDAIIIPDGGRKHSATASGQEPSAENLPAASV